MHPYMKQPVFIQVMAILLTVSQSAPIHESPLHVRIEACRKCFNLLDSMDEDMFRHCIASSGADDDLTQFQCEPLLLKGASEENSVELPSTLPEPVIASRREGTENVLSLDTVDSNDTNDSNRFAENNECRNVEEMYISALLDTIVSLESRSKNDSSSSYISAFKDLPLEEKIIVVAFIVLASILWVVVFIASSKKICTPRASQNSLEQNLPAPPNE